jgi:hypothetical protein
MSPTRHALRAELTRLADQPVDGPSPAFQARLERQLIGSVDAPSGATVVGLPRRHRRLVPVLSVAAATVATVVLAGALLGAFGHGGRGSLQLGNAHDTTVVLPGGHSVPGRTGLGLPNGAVVRTGPNGQAAAGPVQLGPSVEGVVDGGRLQPLPVVAPRLPAVTLPAVTLPSVPTPTLPAPLGLGH